MYVTGMQLWGKTDNQSHASLSKLTMYEQQEACLQSDHLGESETSEGHSFLQAQQNLVEELQMFLSQTEGISPFLLDRMIVKHAKAIESKKYTSQS